MIVVFHVTCSRPYNPSNILRDYVISHQFNQPCPIWCFIRIAVLRKAMSVSSKLALNTVLMHVQQKSIHNATDK